MPILQLQLMIQTRWSAYIYASPSHDQVTAHAADRSEARGLYKMVVGHDE